MRNTITTTAADSLPLAEIPQDLVRALIARGVLPASDLRHNHVTFAVALRGTAVIGATGARTYLASYEIEDLTTGHIGLFGRPGSAYAEMVA